MPLGARVMFRIGLFWAMGSCLAASLGGRVLTSHLPHHLVASEGNGMGSGCPSRLSLALPLPSWPW